MAAMTVGIEPEAAAIRAEEVHDLRRRRARCFVAKIGDEIVHYNWLIFGWAETLQAFCHTRGGQ